MEPTLARPCTPTSTASPSFPGVNRYGCPQHRARASPNSEKQSGAEGVLESSPRCVITAGTTRVLQVYLQYRMRLPKRIASQIPERGTLRVLLLGAHIELPDNTQQIRQGVRPIEPTTIPCFDKTQGKREAQHRTHERDTSPHMAGAEWRCPACDEPFLPHT